MPSVHRMDYICLQLKADCLGPRSGEKFEHSVWLLNTPFISLQGTNVTPAVRTWVFLLVFLLLFSDSLPEICRCASFFHRLVSYNFTLTSFLVINIFLKQTKEEKKKRKKRKRRIKKRRKKRKGKKKKVTVTVAPCSHPWFTLNNFFFLVLRTCRAVVPMYATDSNRNYTCLC